MFIRFNNSNKKYKCTIKKKEKDIQVSFYDEYEANKSGFRIYTDEGALLGNYPDHVNIKEVYADGFLYSMEVGEKDAIEEQKTLGKRVEELEEAVDCANNAIEELLFCYILKDKENTEENE